MKNQVLSLLRLLLIALLASAISAGCGEGDNGDDTNGVNAGNSGEEENGDEVENGGNEENGGEEPEGLPESCTGECREQDLTIEIGGKSGQIERAVYGLTAPSLSERGVWELYIQGIEGGFEGCPEFDSPTPDWELVLVGLPAALAQRTYSKEDDELNAVFFDFLDDFTPELALVATTVTVEPVAARVDTENAGSDDEEGFVSLDIKLVFGEESQTIEGRLVATHCASMDELGAGN